VDAAEYAQLIADFIARDDPRIQALGAAATALDDAIRAADDTITAARQQYAAAFDNVKPLLKEALENVVPIDEIRNLLGGVDLSAPHALHLEAALGPLHLAVTTPTVQMTDPRDGSTVTLGPAPPDAFVARLDAGPVRGGGVLVRRPDGLGGLLTANVGVAEVAVLASLREVQGGPSFLAILSAGFTPGLQVGFGFQINRIGGIIGIERRLDPEALARKLGDGSAATVLFPLDVGNNGLAALATAEQLFPPSPGSAVAGPTFRFAWLEVAGQGFASVDLGVLVELPGPRRIALVGVLKAGIQSVVQLRADFAGVIDFAQQRATVDATLVDSGALGIFRVYGDLAFVSSWGPASYTVLSLGGFYPGFRPEPAQIRPLNRLGMAPDVPLPGLRMRAEGYLAATSNTLQIGGHIEVGVDAGIASISGFLGVDALVQFTPFHINAAIEAGLDVRFLGQTFCGVSFHGTLDGPGPVTLSGRLTVETFFKDFDFDKTFVIGSPAPPPEIPGTRALEAVRAEARPDNLSAIGGADRMVTLAPVARSGKHAVVAPLGGVEWRQHAVPLDTPIDRIAGVPIGSIQTVHAKAPQPQLASDQVKDRFAPGSFITLTAAESLNGPTYDDLPAGLHLHGGTVPGADTPRGADVTVLRKVRGEDALISTPTLGSFQFPGAVLAMVADRDRSATVASSTVAVTVTPHTWVATSGTIHDSATQAMQAARINGGVALASADTARPVTMEGL
jgi:hypothetical protein